MMGFGDGPRPTRPFAVLGFHTTHEALAAEQVLLGLRIPVTPIPTPVSIAARCGISLRLVPEDRDRAVAALSGQGIDVQSIGEIQDV